MKRIQIINHQYSVLHVDGFIKIPFARKVDTYKVEFTKCMLREN